MNRRHAGPRYEAQALYHGRPSGTVISAPTAATFNARLRAFLLAVLGAANWADRHTTRSYSIVVTRAPVGEVLGGYWVAPDGVRWVMAARANPIEDYLHRTPAGRWTLALPKRRAVKPRVRRAKPKPRRRARR
jgi:hypothetical protein